MGIDSSLQISQIPAPVIPVVQPIAQVVQMPWPIGRAWRSSLDSLLTGSDSSFQISQVSALASTGRAAPRPGCSATQVGRAS